MSSAVAQLRQLVRLLRSPDSGLPGLTARFLLSGSVGAVVYVLITTLAANVAGLPFQAALGLGFFSALCLNFVSQRHFVWAKTGQYALPIHRQAGRFGLMACAQYGVTVAATLLLPRALGLPIEIVYLVTISILSLINFLILRHRIFHAAPASASAAVQSQ
jgi:putative flippase GtrA